MTARLPDKKIFSLVAIASAALFLTTIPSFAQQEGTDSQVGAIGIQVSSPVYNFGIDPGGSAQDIVKLRNVGEQTQTFYPEVLDFKALNETGTPQFILSQESENYTYSLASWVKMSKEGITLKPNESAALNFTINVPKDAEAGGRYAGILFGTSPPQASGNQIAISNKVGSLILVRINGDAKEEANLKEFTTPKNFYEYPPVDFVVRVENTGNVHVIPKGTIEVKNWFGATVATADVNSKNGSVLPGSIRKYDKATDSLTWQPKGLSIGKYTANLRLAYGGATGKQIVGSLSFWVIPWKLLLILLLALIIFILVLIFLVKRYNRWVVSRAEKKSPPSEPPPGTEQTNSSQNSPPAQ